MPLSSTWTIRWWNLPRLRRFRPRIPATARRLRPRARLRCDNAVIAWDVASVPGTALAALAAGDGGFGFVVGFALAFGGALVPLLFALGQREFAFYAAFAEVEPGGDKSETLLTGGTFELSNFVLMQQQLACAQRIVIHGVAMREGADVRSEEHTFSVLQQSVGVLEVGLALANGLDLGAAESDAGLELVEQRIAVAGRPVEEIGRASC